MIKVLLADDHSIVRAGLRRIIEESGDMAVTAEAENGRVALREAARHTPDIAVVDISMPDIDGLEVITRLHETMPDLPILVLTMHEERSEDAVEVLALRVLKGDKSASPIDALSMRELQVLRRLAMGQTNREIAEAYGVSVKTVDTYRHRLLKKLDLRNNAELSRFAIQNKLVEL